MIPSIVLQNLVVLHEDVNECEEGTSRCHQKAACVNVPGSYNCQCEPGFIGNGRTCTGKFINLSMLE